MTVVQNDKGAIVLRFIPMDAPKEETILVKLEEEASGIQHTDKVNATCSVSEEEKPVVADEAQVKAGVCVYA